MSHARGVTWLMQQRGPDAYMEDWDKAMLFSFRSMIVSSATSLPPLPFPLYQGRVSSDHDNR